MNWCGCEGETVITVLTYITGCWKSESTLSDVWGSKEEVLFSLYVSVMEVQSLLSVQFSPYLHDFAFLPFIYARGDVSSTYLSIKIEAFIFILFVYCCSYDKLCLTSLIISIKSISYDGIYFFAHCLLDLIN